jgi:hypothetical protein
VVRRRGARPPRGTVHPLLDLHGLTAAEAVRRTERWLRDRRADGARTVVVVTGRGARSPGLPVLRPEVEHLLGALRGSVVAGWEDERGGGGFTVRLRDPPVAAGPPADPAERVVRQAPEALRRRAEEALRELGVNPTAALLAAEIRRLRASAPGEE